MIARSRVSSTLSRWRFCRGLVFPRFYWEGESVPERGLGDTAFDILRLLGLGRAVSLFSSFSVEHGA